MLPWLCFLARKIPNWTWMKRVTSKRKSGTLLDCSQETSGGLALSLLGVFGHLRDWRIFVRTSQLTARTLCATGLRTMLRTCFGSVITGPSPENHSLMPFMKEPNMLNVHLMQDINKYRTLWATTPFRAAEYVLVTMRRINGRIRCPTMTRYVGLRWRISVSKEWKP